MVSCTMPIAVGRKCRSGGIGRRPGLKILCSLERAGSTPVSGTKYRGVEQLAARRAHNPEVVGSSPTAATRKTVTLFGWLFFCPATGPQPVGRRFKSYRRNQKSSVFLSKHAAFITFLTIRFCKNRSLPQPLFRQKNRPRVFPVSSLVKAVSQTHISAQSQFRYISSAQPRLDRPQIRADKG